MDDRDASGVAEPPAATISVGPLVGTALAPFAAWLGIEVREADRGKSALVMAPGRHLVNRRQAVHGGAIAALADSSMAIAMRTLEKGLETAGTIDLNLHFTAPGTGELTARAEVKHAGGSIAFCQCEVRNAEGVLVATAMGSFKLRRPRPA